MDSNELLRFPLSKLKKVKGSRRRAREKTLQILTAHEISGAPWQAVFNHAFYREYNFGDEPEEKNTEQAAEQGEKKEKLLTPDEILELEADIPIDWAGDEIDFAKNLIELTLGLKVYINGMIDELTENWELERIAVIDRVLMNIAITELIKFPQIPPKVSINEAIDIAKKYSTEKSGTFINGILDSVLERLKKDGKLNKSGRGLVNH